MTSTHERSNESPRAKRADADIRAWQALIDLTHDACAFIAMAGFIGMLAALCMGLR